MFGPRLTSIFKSRWMALFWAGGVIWTAVSFVGFAGDADHADDGAAPVAINSADAETIAHAMDGP